MDPTEFSAAVARATRAADAYYNGAEPVMSDADYDRLVDEIRDYTQAHPEAEAQAHALLTQVAAGTSTGGDVVHTVPMLSLDKRRDLGDVEAFAAKIAALGGTISIEPKFDGLAFNARYEAGRLVQASTRGDGRTGEDLTGRISLIPVTGLPHRIPYDRAVNVRGELLMTREDFAFSNRNRQQAGKPAFANPRNATAGVARKEDLDYPVRLTFVAYDSDLGWDGPTLTANGFLPSSAVPTGDEPGEDVIARVLAFGDYRQRPEFGYPTDGIVLKTVEHEIREQLGATSRAPRWAIAYKYEAETAETTIREILEGVGRTGNISYTAVFDPVTVAGSTISRATLHNPDIIASLGVGVGMPVVVYKANDIIPRVGRVLERPEGTSVYLPSDTSPSGAPLDKTNAIWRSTDPADSIGALISYAASRDALDIDGISTAIADALVDGEEPLVTDLADLFTLTVDQLAALPLGVTETGTTRRLGRKVAQKIAANIEDAKTRPLNRVLTALGLRKMGHTFGRRLAAHFRTMDAILAASEEDLLAAGIDGIGPERARLFHDGFQRMRPVIEKMRAAGVNMGQARDTTEDAPLPLAGMTVVASGAMTGPLEGLTRTQVGELIERLGGKTAGSVSKNTSLLVTNETGTSKAVKAARLGIETITPEAFAGRVGIA